MAGKAGHRGFGHLRKLPSGRVQASYIGPDTVRYLAPQTFDTKEDAEAWLVDERRRISAGTWVPPGQRVSATPLTLREYAPTWLANRRTRKGQPLRPRTRQHYDDLLARSLLPTFGALPLPAITPEAVDRWWVTLPESTPTQNAHAYALLSAVMESARKARTIPVSANPCQIDGARVVDRKVRIDVATLDELATIHDAMPPRLRLAVLLAAWCGVRFGELFELRRGDVRITLDDDGPSSGFLRVTRGVVRSGGAVIIDKPKTSAGVRDVAIPPHLLPAVVAHLDEHVEPGAAALLFPSASGGNMAPSTLYKSWYRARSAAGRDDLRWHDLRHVAAVYAAQAGATLAELMARLGHSSPVAAMRYQHAARDRDAAIAAALSKMATGGSE